MQETELHPSESPATGANRSVNRDWLRALQRTALSEQNSCSTLPLAFDEVLAAQKDALAVIDERERVTYAEFSRRANRYARWALAEGLQKGDVVALLMGNCADYAAVWLGLTRAGAVVALLNINLPAQSLAHCLRIVKAKAAIADAALHGACLSACALLEEPPRLHRHGETAAGFSGEPLGPAEMREIAPGDRALYIFTSGTTGLPKAAIVTHRRVLSWSLWFSGLIDAGPQDRMYNCLPMYHSVGGVVAVWSVLLSGGSVVVRARFSASAFWRDVAAEGCTLFQYIGELCRYLLNAPDCEAQERHRLRLAVGNGLRADIWKPFQRRFAIPRVLEFYAATESNFSLYNVEGEPGAIGRIPAFLAPRFGVALVRFDEASGKPARDAEGRCIRCGVDEAGEAIARIEALKDASPNFEGYASAADSEKKILRDVFEKGDAYMRSGDLMRKDARGFYYFVDRLGDSFRWKGENVSTLEVAEILAACPGVRDANVYGVVAPGCEGRAGMAALAVDEGFDLCALRREVEAKLPPYARPLFLRLSRTLETTETFKHKKQALAAQGFDPQIIEDALYFSPPGAEGYVSLDVIAYRRIGAGEFRW